MSQTASPTPVALRCALEYPDVDAFIARYGRNVSPHGIFLPSREPPAVGTEVRFEVELNNGRLLLRGDGVVVWRVGFDAAQPAALHGLSLRFVRLDGDSRQLLERLFAYKAAHPTEFFVAASDPLLTPPPEPPAPPVVITMPPSVVVIPVALPSAPIVPSRATQPAELGDGVTGPEEEELQQLRRPPAPLPLPPAREAARRVEAILSRRR